MDKIAKWGACCNRSDVRTFLGTLTICHVFIYNFARCAHHINKLLECNIPFEWGPKQEAAQADLKHAVLNSPVLQPLDYQMDSPVKVWIANPQ